MSELLADEFLKRVEEAKQLNEWKSVEHWAKQWIQSNAKNSEAFRWLARASLSLHKLERAAYAFNRVLDYLPSDKEAIEFFQENPSSASDFGRSDSSTNCPTSDDPLTRVSPKQREDLAATEEKLAQKYFQLELFAEAAQRFEQSFFWKASEISALGYAKSLQRNGEGHKAQKYLRDKIAVNGDWIKGRLLLGNILFEMGQLRAAQNEWQSVLKSDPNNSEALNLLRGYHLGQFS